MARIRNICILTVVLVIALLYTWITREVSFGNWLICRMFEVQDLRKVFHPDYFVGETLDEAIERRAKADRMVAMGSRVFQHDMAEVHDVDLAVKGGNVPLRINIPQTRNTFKAVILWIHGGGWTTGSVDAYDAVSKDIAVATSMIVVSVGYRLSPEAKFPVPMQDCIAAVRWVRENIWSFGGDRTRMGLVGESAGGNLALTTAMRMGRRWLPFLPRKSDLCAVVAASPAVSYEHAKQGPGGDDGEWRSYKRYARGYGLEATQMKGYWDLYLEKEQQGRNPLASPLRASKRTLRGLPPVMLIRAEHEILWDEVLALGKKIVDVGSKLEEFQSKSCVHGSFAKGDNSCGKSSLERTASFLREHCS